MKRKEGNDLIKKYTFSPQNYEFYNPKNPTECGPEIDILKREMELLR